MAQRTNKRKSDYGSVYKGHEGQWSWLLHRITGVGIILFLFAQKAFIQGITLTGVKG